MLMNIHSFQRDFERMQQLSSSVDVLCQSVTLCLPSRLTADDAGGIVFDRYSTQCITCSRELNAGWADIGSGELQNKPIVNRGIQSFHRLQERGCSHTIPAVVVYRQLSEINS
jgi:hypothetical protein